MGEGGDSFIEVRGIPLKGVYLEQYRVTVKIASTAVQQYSGTALQQYSSTTAQLESLAQYSITAVQFKC